MSAFNSQPIVFLQKIILAFLLVAMSSANASTIWNGPNIGFYHASSDGDPVDTLTTIVKLTRSTGGGGLYNSAIETGAASGISPKGTAWATGTLAQFTNGVVLTFGACPLEAGHHPPGFIGTTYVVHLITNDIYLQLTLTNWGGTSGIGDKSFGYIRSTPAPVIPIISITSPAPGALFVAPASVTIQATASESGGTIANVQFRVGSNILTNETTSPFSAITNNLTAGTYTLFAIATDSLSVTATNSVNITVDAPPSVTITNPVTGAVLAAPANLNIRANASDSDGLIANVQFLLSTATATNVLTNITTSPYFATSNNVGTNNYRIFAVATDNNGVKNTNSISISVVAPITVSLTNSATVASTNFQFKYAANVGLSYVIQVSTNLALGNWISLATNVAASNPVVFVDARATNHSAFYRVGRLPNP
jgi:hypothetical protein